jgi:uncharacterized protein YydD (DUF2326 family)
MRKEARKHPEFKSKLKLNISISLLKFLNNIEKKTKDIKIPKLAPFKDELLQQAEDAKLQLEQERQIKKQERTLARQQKKTERPKSLESLVNDIERRQNVFDHEKISTVNFLFFFFCLYRIILY